MSLTKSEKKRDCSQSTKTRSSDLKFSFTPYKGIRVPESEEFLLVECGILGFGIWNTAQGIRNPTNDWNPVSKFQCQRIRNPVREIQNPWRGIQTTRLAVLDSLTGGDFTIAALFGSLEQATRMIREITLWNYIFISLSIYFLVVEAHILYFFGCNDFDWSVC